MDLLDALITVIIIAVVLLGNVSKFRKKIASLSNTPVVSQPGWEDEETSFEDENYEKDWVTENEKKETKSSKSEPYFTYETVSEQNEQETSTVSISSSQTRDIHIQEVENETETNNLDLQDPEELKKAIIYGEILKNPYN